MQDIPFLISADLGECLANMELLDAVVCENVQLNDYIPKNSVTAPPIKTRAGKRTYLDPETLTKASINSGVQRIRRSSANVNNSSPGKEKEYLRSRAAELESTIEQQMKQIATLNRRKAQLERQLSDQRARGRISSNLGVPTEHSKKQTHDSTDNDANIAYWKELYEEMEKKYQALHDTLSSKGVILRVSARKSRAIPPPKGAPQFD
ncbi:hypothetical protein GPJ56_001410 [Histomonas meleagridis]|uniref:uncharacterized protein n=1 Tax=Histomonas meleagridis TaxID=135588 RepID=UPI00355A3DBC|nr:hypothetical protein GPJ56_001410 [Histomonas meleagridis]KAH0798170.1 hypothetical protein GO595_009016 [Histomonas meleagridis]